MTAQQVLEAMAKEVGLADLVLQYLNHGMLDEWDCSLEQGLQNGFGGVELQLAARSGWQLCQYHDAHPPEADAEVVPFTRGDDPDHIFTDGEGNDR